jgi:hypothetical protein
MPCANERFDLLRVASESAIRTEEGSEEVARRTRRPASDRGPRQQKRGATAAVKEHLNARTASTGRRAERTSATLPQRRQLALDVLASPKTIGSIVKAATGIGECLEVRPPSGAARLVFVSGHAVLGRPPMQGWRRACGDVLPLALRSRERIRSRSMAKTADTITPRQSADRPARQSPRGVYADIRLAHLTLFFLQRSRYASDRTAIWNRWCGKRMRTALDQSHAT